MFLNFKRSTFFSLSILIAVSLNVNSYCITFLPKNGTFDTDSGGPMSFSPIPWDSPDLLSSVYVQPFASSDKYASRIPGDYNLSQAKFSNHSISYNDYGAKTGDLGIRVGNFAVIDRTFSASVLTLHLSSSDFDVYLPDYTYPVDAYTYFWVSTIGGVFYANSSMGPGIPDMTAAEAMAAGDGDTYRLTVPEPTTIFLLGLGTIFVRKRL